METRSSCKSTGRPCRRRGRHSFGPGGSACSVLAGPVRLAAAFASPMPFVPLGPEPMLRRYWFVAALLALFFALSIKYSHKALHNRSAIVRWQPQLYAVEANDSYWRLYVYPSPPIMAMILQPFSYLSPL